MPKILQIIYTFFILSIDLYYIVCYYNTIKGGNNMKGQYQTLSGDTIKQEFVVFEAEDVNDPTWNPIVRLLQKNGYQVLYGDGNYMNIVIREKRICQKKK